MEETKIQFSSEIIKLYRIVEKYLSIENPDLEQYRSLPTYKFITSFNTSTFWFPLPDIITPDIITII